MEIWTLKELSDCEYRRCWLGTASSHLSFQMRSLPKNKVNQQRKEDSIKRWRKCGALISHLSPRSDHALAPGQKSPLPPS